MRRSHPAALLSALCFALGAVWVWAGAMKLTFGIRVTVWFLPPVGLERVEPVPAILTGLAFALVGALLGRSAWRDGGRRTDAEPAGAEPTLLPNTQSWTTSTPGSPHLNRNSAGRAAR